MKKNIGILLIILMTSVNLHASRGFLNCLKNDNHLKKTVIIFYSPDCGYCSKMEKEIAQNEKFQELIKSKYNIHIVNIKTDEGQKIAALYKVKAVPTIINYDQTSLVIKKSKGFGSINKLSSFLNLNRYAKTNIGNFSSSVCGDGILEGNEVCDDGNTLDGDGCSSTCESESLAINEYDIAFTALESYPIPFTNKLTVSFYLLHNSDVELLVFDILGKQVHAKKIDNVSFGKNEIVFEHIQFLQSGNYILKINVKNKLGSYFKITNILKK